MNLNSGIKMMVEEKEEKSFAIIQIPPKFSWSLASSYTWTSASSWKRKEKVRTEEKLISNDKLLKILWLSQYRFNLYLKDFFLSFPTPLLLFYKKMSKTINIKKIKIKLIFLKKKYCQFLNKLCCNDLYFPPCFPDIY